MAQYNTPSPSTVQPRNDEIRRETPPIPLPVRYGEPARMAAFTLCRSPNARYAAHEGRPSHHAPDTPRAQELPQLRRHGADARAGADGVSRRQRAGQEQPARSGGDARPDKVHPGGAGARRHSLRVAGGDAVHEGLGHGGATGRRDGGGAGRYGAGAGRARRPRLPEAPARRRRAQARGAGGGGHRRRAVLGGGPQHRHRLARQSTALPGRAALAGRSRLPARAPAVPARDHPTEPALAAHPRGAGPHAGVGLLGRRAVPPRRAGHGAAAGRRRRARAGERRCLCGHGGGRRPLRGRIRAEHRPRWAGGRGRGPRHGPARRATAAGGADGAEPRGPAPRRPSIDRRRAGRGAVWVAWAGEDGGALASAGGGHLPASRDGRGAGAAAWTMCSRSWTGSVDSTCWRRRAARSRRWSRWSRERSRPACTRPSRRTPSRPARCT